MPTVNIYYQQEQAELNALTSSLKKYVAEQLSCGDIQLSPGEVSVRHVKTEGTGSIADVEVEITAHSFSERVSTQDEICLAVRRFILDNTTSFEDARVWLLLCELGHSWGEEGS
jgi:hypothetical protein